MKNPEIKLAKLAKAAGYSRKKFVRIRTETVQATATRDNWRRSETALALSAITSAADAVFGAMVLPRVAPLPLPPARQKVPSGGRRCGVCGKDQGARGEGLGGFKTALAALKEAGVKLAIPGAMHAHVSCIRKAKDAQRHARTAKATVPAARPVPPKPLTRTERQALQEQRDRHAKVMRSMRASKGWTHYHVWEPKIATIKQGDGTAHMMTREKLYTVFVSPKGNEYTHALDTEPADLLHTGVTKSLGVPPVRLIRVEKSQVVKRSEQARRRADKIRQAREEN